MNICGKMTAGAARIGALTLGILISGCSQYLDRRDTLTSWTGDSVRANIALQTIDPWPEHAADKDIRFNGERMGNAVDNYRSGPRRPQPSGGTTSGTPSQSADSGNLTQ